MNRPTRDLRRSLSACWLALVCSAPSLADGPRSVTIRGDGRERGESPLVVECPSSIEPGDYRLASSDGSTLPATVFRDREKSYLGMVLDRLPAQGDRTFRFESDHPTTSPGREGVELSPTGRRVVVKVKNQVLTEYVPDDGPKPYFFPLVGPSGASMTRAYPMKTVEGEKLDHPHHRSLWFTHGNVNKVNFWTELPNHGTIRETARPTVASGSVVGRLRTMDDWVGPDGKKVCEDERVVTFYATSKTRVLDFDITLRASAGPVTFGDTKEGMFGLRVATSMDVTSKQGGTIVNAEGVTDKAAWGKASPWVDYSGPVAGKTVGIAILNGPESFRYPTTWHVRDYGLFAANPFGWHDFGRKESGEHVLPAGESIRFAYRVILHEGDASSAQIVEAARTYAEPPRVVIP